MERQITNLVITGFSGTGKSLVAKEVAQRLGWQLFDSDQEVARRAGKPIAQIFHEDGEARFRELEREAVRQAARQTNTVIALGGGAIVDQQNYEELAKTGLIICLEAKPETIYQRLFQQAAGNSSTEARPLLAVDNPLERIRELKASRQPFYARADWTIHTDNLTIVQVSEEVIRAWRLLKRTAPRPSPVHSGGGKGSLTLQPDEDIACLVETATQSYPVYVGYRLLEKLGEKMKSAGLSGTSFIISDQNVFRLYGDRVREILREASFGVNFFILPPGEETKSIDSAVKIYDFLVQHRAERNDVIVALGGGMVGDLAGFVAATFLRGIPWVQVPTSLIGMVDASIGGKVGVNHPEGKNLIGAFYQPSLVLADCQTLTTLSQRELTSGWAELVKHGLILDREFFAFLEASVDKLRALEPEVLTQAIARSAAIKANVVSLDEREREGIRTILNYGHTIAHGLEAATEYRQFLHGEAVAIGMTGAAKLSERLGLLPSTAAERQECLLRRFGLPTSLRAVSQVKLSLTALTHALELDKKIRGKSIHWVLLQDIGKAVIRSDVPREDVLAVLQDLVESSCPA